MELRTETNNAALLTACFDHMVRIARSAKTRHDRLSPSFVYSLKSHVLTVTARILIGAVIVIIPVDVIITDAHSVMSSTSMIVFLLVACSGGRRQQR